MVISGKFSSIGIYEEVTEEDRKKAEKIIEDFKIFADELFKRTRKAAEKDRDKISREVEQRIKDNGVALALGRLAGGAVGGLGGRWVGQQLHDHTPVGHMADSLRDKITGDKAEAAAASNSGGGGSGGGGSGGNPGGPPPAH